ncbi:hypothetical protein Hanom_Chr08g00700841 [Helianthus anomalus]
MFVCLTYRKKFLVHVCSFTKRTNINKLPNERFVYSPSQVSLGTCPVKNKN